MFRVCSAMNIVSVSGGQYSCREDAGKESGPYSNMLDV